MSYLLEAIKKDGFIFSDHTLKHFIYANIHLEDHIYKYILIEI